MRKRQTIIFFPLIMASQYEIITSLHAPTYKRLDDSQTGKSKNNTVLMGSFVKLLNEETDVWQKVLAFSIEGWIEKRHLGESPGMKCFFVDVGQGDGALIEIGNDEDGIKILIDGGPSDNLSRYLSKWQYKYYFNQGLPVHFDYVFISHFDKDHYQGLIDIINDDHYTFGAIYHNGIAKFNDEKNTFPPSYDTELGKTVIQSRSHYLITSFDSLDELLQLRDQGGMLDLMERFVGAVQNATIQSRVHNFKRIDFTNRDLISKTINGVNFGIEVLGPVTTRVNEKLAFKYFEDEAHTINGHSLVLKLHYGHRTFLFGGDLNIPSEDHLLLHYHEEDNPFQVDVAKSCHHGASEFTMTFMAKVNPLATVISSADNESYSHPRADAIGCAGKYTRSERPLVFSTELARSSNVSTDEVKYGMINLRSDRSDIIMAQMKEAVTAGNVWELYTLS